MNLDGHTHEVVVKYIVRITRVLFQSRKKRDVLYLGKEICIVIYIVKKYKKVIY